MSWHPRTKTKKKKQREKICWQVQNNDILYSYVPCQFITKCHVTLQAQLLILIHFPPCRGHKVITKVCLFQTGYKYFNRTPFAESLNYYCTRREPCEWTVHAIPDWHKSYLVIYKKIKKKKSDAPSDPSQIKEMFCLINHDSWRKRIQSMFYEISLLHNIFPAKFIVKGACSDP